MLQIPPPQKKICRPSYYTIPDIHISAIPPEHKITADSAYSHSPSPRTFGIASLPAKREHITNKKLAARMLSVYQSLSHSTKCTFIIASRDFQIRTACKPNLNLPLPLIPDPVIMPEILINLILYFLEFRNQTRTKIKIENDH